MNSEVMEAAIDKTFSSQQLRQMSAGQRSHDDRRSHSHLAARMLVPQDLQRTQRAGNKVMTHVRAQANRHSHNNIGSLEAASSRCSAAATQKQDGSPPTSARQIRAPTTMGATAQVGKPPPPPLLLRSRLLEGGNVLAGEGLVAAAGDGLGLAGAAVDVGVGVAVVLPMLPWLMLTPLVWRSADRSSQGAARQRRQTGGLHGPAAQLTEVQRSTVHAVQCSAVLCR